MIRNLLVEQPVYLEHSSDFCFATPPSPRRLCRFCVLRGARLCPLNVPQSSTKILVSFTIVAAGAASCTRTVCTRCTHSDMSTAHTSVLCDNGECHVPMLTRRSFGPARIALIIFARGFAGGGAFRSTLRSLGPAWIAAKSSPATNKGEVRRFSAFRRDGPSTRILPLESPDGAGCDRSTLRSFGPDRIAARRSPMRLPSRCGVFGALRHVTLCCTSSVSRRSWLRSADFAQIWSGANCCEEIA